MSTDFNIEPTRQAYARMPEMFREAIKRHEQDIDDLEEIGIRMPVFYIEGRNVDELSHEAIDLLIASKQTAIKELEASIASIEAYLA